jgi:cytochrome P450
LEARIAVETVLDRLPGVALTSPSAARGLVFRKPEGVHVRWEVP